MAERLAAIGDAPEKRYKVVGEMYPLPDSRKGVVAAVERILDLGGVRRLTIELGKPIQVARMVAQTAEVPDSPVELMDGDDVYAAARNAEMEDLIVRGIPGGRPIEKMTPYEVLFVGFDTLFKRRLKAKALLVHSHSNLRSWLMVDAHQDVREVFGVEVREHKEIPDDAALLVATTLDDTDSVVFSLRIEMVSPRAKKVPPGPPSPPTPPPGRKVA